MNADERPSQLILKVGGSLFSDKHRDDAVDAGAIRRWAAIVGRLAREAEGRLVFITGGGSAGHGALRGLDPADRLAPLALTAANFGLKWHWTQALRAAGHPAVPLQLAAMCTLGADGPSMHDEVLRRLLGEGVLPVLSGDSLLNAHGGLDVFSSDRVPEALLPGGGPRPRVVALTDVPGICADGAGGRRVLAHVDPFRPDLALEAVRASATWDATGSMAGKLDALLALARRGAECFVMRGDPELDDLGFLLDPVDTWPAGLVRTRISRSPAPVAVGLEAGVR